MQVFHNTIVVVDDGKTGWFQKTSDAEYPNLQSIESASIESRDRTKDRRPGRTFDSSGGAGRRLQETDFHQLEEIARPQTAEMLRTRALRNTSHI